MAPGYGSSSIGVLQATRSEAWSLRRFRRAGWLRAWHLGRCVRGALIDFRHQSPGCDWTAKRLVVRD